MAGPSGVVGCIGGEGRNASEVLARCVKDVTDKTTQREVTEWIDQTSREVWGALGRRCAGATWSNDLCVKERHCENFLPPESPSYLSHGKSVK